MLLFGTLGRYFSAQFARTTLLVFGTIFTLIYVIDFVELMRRSGDVQGASTSLMARLALFRSPSYAEQVLPFAVLFGSMATMLQLSRKLELVVARSVGISAWQFLQPGVFVAGLIGCLAVVAFNPLSAFLKQQASAIEARVFGQGRAVSDQEIWLRQKSVDGQSIVRAEGAIGGTATLSRVTVFTFNEAGGFVDRIEASEATLRPGYWELKDAQVQSPGEEPATYGTYLVATNLEPSQVRQSFMPPEAVPFWSLSDTIAQTERAGLDAVRYRLQYDMLLARPLLFVAMVLVAASVSLRFFRFGGVAKMVLSGVAAGFMLYVATELMGDLGASGLVSPAVAAWFPVVVGSSLGTLALLYQEDG